MKKVLLINTNTEKAPYPVPPIGLCIVAQSLETYYQVQLYDGMFDEGKNLPTLVATFKPDYIGCSIRNIDSMSIETKDFFLDKVNELFIKPIKEISQAPIILGGSGFSIFPLETLEYLDLNYGIAGEGEDAFLKLLQHLDGGKDIMQVKGIIDRASKAFEMKKIATCVHPTKTFHSGITKYINFGPYAERGAYPIQAKRGCAHHCIYCTYPLIEGKKFRSRTASDIVDEIAQVRAQLGDICFEFVDSTFNDPAGHAEAICSEIIRRKLKLRLRTMGINPQNTSEELVLLMRQAGFTQIDSTPDTASPLMLHNLGKNFTLAQLQKTAQWLKKADMPTMWFFVFGGPGETRATIDETFAFMEHYVSEADLVYLASSLRIYPHTKLWQLAVAEGIVCENDSLLKPVFYDSPSFPHTQVSEYLRLKIGRRHNILFTSDARPSPEMMRETMQYRMAHNLNEPMFRSLLNVRKLMMDENRL
ncbi:MAG: radical SAM protein [Bacteroidota bacterium]